MLQVKQYRMDGATAWGVTNGKKWFAYAYRNEQAASTALHNLLNAKDQSLTIKVNVAYDAPLSVV